MAVLDFAAHSFGYYQPDVWGDDGNGGNKIVSEGCWIDDYCMCDCVPAGKANTITIPDGQVEPYSYTVYNLPTWCKEFKYGDRVRIKLFGAANDVREFTVKGFHRYQLQCKIWV